MNRFLRWGVASLVLGALALVSANAKAVIVERVVAVVGERPILLTELQHRARPNLLTLAAQSNRDASFSAAAETEIFKQVLSRMIDDRLEEQAADKARVAVTPEEIDNGLQRVAANNRVSVADVLSEARRSGLTEQDFRDELRRQLLEFKLVELRVRPRVKVTEQDGRNAYAKWQSEFAQQNPIDFRIIVMSASSAAGDDDAEKQAELANQVAASARSGSDFCALVAQYSLDQATKATCGSPGPQPMRALPPGIQSLLRGMNPGDVSDPLRVPAPDGRDALAIVQFLGVAKLPPYEQVHAQMMQRALLEGLERQRLAWLQELRRGVHVDIRM